MTTDQLTRAQVLLNEVYGIVRTLSERDTIPPQPVKPDNRKKLTKRDALVIRQMRRAGSTQQEIADSFDVNRVTISRIVRGIYWK